jgi:hypothetical protein
MKGLLEPGEISLRVPIIVKELKRQAEAFLQGTTELISLTRIVKGGSHQESLTIKCCQRGIPHFPLDTLIVSCRNQRDEDPHQRFRKGAGGVKQDSCKQGCHQPKRMNVDTHG